MIRCWPIFRRSHAGAIVHHRARPRGGSKWHHWLRPRHAAITWTCAAVGSIAGPALVASPPPVIVPTAGPAILASGTGGWPGGWPEGGGAWGADVGWLPTESVAAAFQGSPQPGLLPLVPSSTLENLSGAALPQNSHPMPEPSGAAVLAFGLAAMGARKFISARRGA